MMDIQLKIFYTQLGIIILYTIVAWILDPKKDKYFDTLQKGYYIQWAILGIVHVIWGLIRLWT